MGAGDSRETDCVLMVREKRANQTMRPKTQHILKMRGERERE